MQKYVFKHKILIVVSFISMILTSFLDVIQALLFKVILDSANGTASTSLASLVIYVAIFLLALLILQAFSRISKEALSTAIMTDYKEDIVNNYLNMDNQSRFTSSKFISIMTNDLKEIEDNYVNNILNLFKDIFLFIISLIFLFKISPYLAFTILAIVWFPILLPQILNKKSQKLKENYLVNIEKFTNDIREISQGFEVIKGFNIEDKISKMFLQVNRETQKSSLKSNSLLSIQSSIAVFSGLLMFFINCLISAYLVMKGKITIGSLVASIQLMNHIVNPIMYISSYTSRIKSVENVIASIDETILDREENSSGENKPYYFDKTMILKDLSYSYDGEENVISNLNYRFVRGKKYAIVGESGCGKTTLLKILMKQIGDYSGDIKMDGLSIKDILSEDYYKNVSLIQQQTFLFNDSLKNNICLYNDFGEEKFKSVLEDSGLNKIVEKHKEGADVLVGEGNVELSGGELNRVSIARALIKNSQLLLIDEATSSLDKKTSYDVESTLTNLDMTIIAITHKLDENILKRYDEILVMKNGQIVESGSFEELLEKERFFSQIYNLTLEERESI